MPVHQVKGTTLIGLLCLITLLPTLAWGQSEAELRSQMLKLYKQKRYPETLVVARQLYEKTKSPMWLVNIGRCYDLMGKPVLALRYYGRHIKEAPKSDHAPAVRKRMAMLRTQLQKTMREVRIITRPPGAVVKWPGSGQVLTPATRWLPFGSYRLAIRKAGHRPQVFPVHVPAGTVALVVTLTLTPLPGTGELSVESNVRGALVYLGGKLIGETPLNRLRVPAGRFTLRVVAGKHRAWTTSVAIDGVRRTVIRAELLPTVAHSPGMSRFRIAAWSTLGTGLAVLGTGLAFQFLGRAKASDAQNAITGKPKSELTDADWDRYNSRYSKAQTYQYVAYGLYAVGGALLVSSTVLFFIKPRRQERLSWLVAPTVSSTHLSLSARLQF